MENLRLAAWIVALAGWVAFATAGWSQNYHPPRPNFDELSEQARKAQHDGQGREAMRLYLKALEIRPEWAGGWQNVGLLLADLKDFSRAEVAFKNALKNDPKDGTSWAMLGLVEFEEGRTDEAYSDIQRGRNLRIRNADLEHIATYRAATIEIARGEFELARPNLARLAREEVDDQDLILAFGLAALRIPVFPEKLAESRKQMVMRVGQIEYQAIHTAAPEIIQEYQQLLGEFPQAEGLHYAFGNYLFEQAHYDEGLAQMRKELELNPKDAMAELQMVMTYLKLSQPDKALPLAENAARLRPDFFAARYALGWTLYRLGRNDRAIAELETAVKLDPDNPRIHFALSEAYQHAHRKDDAERERAIFAKMRQADATAAPRAIPRGSASSSRGTASPP